MQIHFINLGPLQDRRIKELIDYAISIRAEINFDAINVVTSDSVSESAKGLPSISILIFGAKPKEVSAFEIGLKFLMPGWGINLCSLVDVGTNQTFNIDVTGARKFLENGFPKRRERGKRLETDTTAKMGRNQHLKARTTPKSRRRSKLSKLLLHESKSGWKSFGKTL